ncbi:MAG TPA: lipoate--protein ligase family protein [Defluviitoga sp.]|nr:lipoate--protein ligase family protein [Defluviitoga sp.]HOP24650.1 lipoate--protein ligase family protein [Defluviitoga sp.]HPZ28847.1 lipoate--protein ligase family protein [Defluviitoga sp.]HQD62612.1 lipoate--protein ligase family protein [Defluviitoga sp.]
MIRLIVDGKREGTMNMALDLSLAESAALEKVTTIRIYEWLRPTLSLGKHQKTHNLDLNYINKEGISIVKRPTGGRGVLHKSEFTYSFSTYLNYDKLPINLLDSYLKISKALVESFKLLGMNAELESSKKSGVTKDICYDAPSIYEIKIDGKKFVGSAQYRTNSFILQHGSIPIEIDYDAYVSCFKYSNKQEIKRYLQGHTIDIKSLNNKNFSKKDLTNAFKKGFGSIFEEEVIEGNLIQKEIQRAENIKNEFIVYL